MQPASGKQFVFYLIVATQTISLIGSRMTSIGLGIWVFSQTGDTTPLLLTAFFTELPGMLVGSLLGVFVDRWDRRRVLILADVGQAAGTLILMLAFLSGGFRVWHLYLIALLQGVCMAFQQPAESATTTVLAPASHRERANAIRQLAFPLAGVIAPALTGSLYAAIGLPGVMTIDLATFLIAILAVYLVRIPRPRPTAEGLSTQGRMLQEWLGGLRYLAARRPLLYFVLYLTFINFLLNGPLELAIPYLILVTGSEALTGRLLSVMSSGAFTGAILVTVWGGARPRMRALLAGLLLSGAMFLAYGTARSPLGLAVSIFLLMAPLPVMNALFISIMQVKTPPDMQGRIFAVIGQLGFLGSTTSFLLTGPLVDRLLNPAVGAPAWRWAEPLVGRAPGAGIGLLLVATGGIILAATLIAYGSPQIRRLETDLPDYEAVAVEG